MLTRYIISLVLLWPVTGWCQFGVNLKYFSGQSDLLDAYQLSQDGVHLAVEYGFRYKPKRIEFHPSIGYRRTFDHEDENPYAASAKHGYIDALDLDFHTDFYPFDFAGDCDCPTWAKEGQFIKKGLFLEVSPGLSIQGLTRTFYVSDPGPPDVPITSTNLLWKLSFGAGIDIGVSEQVTITPIFSWTTVSKAEWEGLDASGTAGTLDDQTYLALGLRMIYKPDSRHRRRY